MNIEPWLLRALAGGIGIALVVGPLGCFVVWRRMAYFGDSLAHSALLGVTLGLLTGFGIDPATIVVCGLFAVLLVWLQSLRILAADTLLGILAHASLSIGLIAASLLKTVRLNVTDYLFGNVLSVTNTDLLWIYGGGTLALFLMVFLWRSLILTTLHEDLARAEGVNAFAVNLCFMALMTLVIAVSSRIIGILLITSLLVIPAATARPFARSPEGMAVLAGGLGVLSVCGGLYGSLRFDFPPGPSIIVTATTLFALLLPGMLLVRGRK
ncbi:MAG: metal ABC transporter permease [Pseudomonadota bacterium]